MGSITGAQGVRIRVEEADFFEPHFFEQDGLGHAFIGSNLTTGVGLLGPCCDVQASALMASAADLDRVLPID